jgi:hypothetical protein
MCQGTKVCRAKDLCWCDLDPKLHNISFRSIIPRQLKIFGWYLVRGCVGGQRCVVQKICVDDVTLTQNCIIIPFRSVGETGVQWIGKIVSLIFSFRFVMMFPFYAAYERGGCCLWTQGSRSLATTSHFWWEVFLKSFPSDSPCPGTVYQAG